MCTRSESCDLTILSFLLNINIGKKKLGVGYSNSSKENTASSTVTKSDINGHTIVGKISKKASVIVSMVIIKARISIRANHFILKHKLI